ncbi:MAG: TIGR01777 family oxidoreductase, partial [Bdellovibrionota bacterium]
DEPLDENSSPGEGFLAEVCKGWESESLALESLGVRRAVVRTGIVLDKGDGALAKLLPIFKAGLGGPLGSGQQWMSWIHLEDLVRLYVWALEEQNIAGAINGVSPQPVRNREFTKDLATCLGRPALIPVPRLALRLAMGEVASVILESQKVVPTKSLKQGFKFAYPKLSETFKGLLS